MKSLIVGQVDEDPIVKDQLGLTHEPPEGDIQYKRKGRQQVQILKKVTQCHTLWTQTTVDQS